jgi:hypothetical protein
LKNLDERRLQNRKKTPTWHLETRFGRIFWSPQVALQQLVSKTDRFRLNSEQLNKLEQLNELDQLKLQHQDDEEELNEHRRRNTLLPHNTGTNQQKGQNLSETRRKLQKLNSTTDTQQHLQTWKSAREQQTKPQ